MALPSSLSGRIEVLDVLRGICILGILVANIVVFSSPEIAREFGFDVPRSASEEWLSVIRDWFVSGKFRGMLCILFGVGMAMQYQKFLARKSAADMGLQPAEKWPGKYLKRTLLLMALGACHGLFIWFGDILFLYSLVALVAMWIVGQSDKSLWIWIGVLSVYALIIGVGSVLGGAMGGGGSEQEMEFFSFLSKDGLIATYQSGSYLDQFTVRGFMFALMLFVGPIVAAPTLMPLFLFGVWLYRKGILTAPSEHPKEVRTIMTVGAVGFLLNGTPLFLKAMGVDLDASQLVEVLFSMLWAGPLIVILAWLYEKSRSGAFWKPLGKVGRIALTAYLSQSVLCTLFFYSWGFGQYGQLDQFQVLGVVAGVWMINILFAYAWLRKFDIGPVEWAWRSMVAGKKLPWRKVEDSGAPPVMG